MQECAPRDDASLPQWKSVTFSPPGGGADSASCAPRVQDADVSGCEEETEEESGGQLWAIIADVRLLTRALTLLF